MQKGIQNYTRTIQQIICESCVGDTFSKCFIAKSWLFNQFVPSLLLFIRPRLLCACVFFSWALRTSQKAKSLSTYICLTKKTTICKKLLEKPNIIQINQGPRNVDTRARSLKRRIAWMERGNMHTFTVEFEKKNFVLLEIVFVSKNEKSKRKYKQFIVHGTLFDIK